MQNPRYSTQDLKNMDSEVTIHLQKEKKLIEQATSVHVGNNTQSVLQNQPSIFGADSIWNDFNKEVVN